MANRRGLESKEVRGRILKILQIPYPDGASDHVIVESLRDAQFAVSPAEVQGHLGYLEQKSYIEMENVESKELELSRNIVKLTPKGVDLLEENIPPDPGVMV